MTCNHVYTLHNVSKLLLKKLRLTADVEKEKSRYSISYTYVQLLERSTSFAPLLKLGVQALFQIYT